MSDPTPTPTAAVVAPTASLDGQFTCPGVPDDAVIAMFGPSVSFLPRFSTNKDDYVTHLFCTVLVPPSQSSGRSDMALTTRWGRLDEGINPWADAYDAPIEDTFTVEGIGGTGTVYTSTEGGGAASFTCEDNYHYVTVSVYPGTGMRGDLKANLINLATSMTPWVCQGHTAPGLPAPIGQAQWPHPTPTP
ncbi:Uncharacterised protein [Actinomyces howellii]|uniref:DUF3558 domain-containing protein n=2 Tax=Actinomyces howellii TaxID=52771 RepID=A0A448HGE5_9ACTO|nr:Uncharacterised protein [Actinomyces howellii]